MHFNRLILLTLSAAASASLTLASPQPGHAEPSSSINKSDFKTTSFDEFVQTAQSLGISLSNDDLNAAKEIIDSPTVIPVAKRSDQQQQVRYDIPAHLKPLFRTLASAFDKDFAASSSSKKENGLDGLWRRIKSWNPFKKTSPGSSLKESMGGLTVVRDVKECPTLKKRVVPNGAVNMHDIRIDEFDTIIGVGDSIMASIGTRFTKPSQFLTNFPFLEYRGANFATGGDDDNISLGSLMKHYNPTLKGLSKGNRFVQVCYGPLCPQNVPILNQYNVPVQGLNAAQSGAWVFNWPPQADYINDTLPTLDPNFKTSKKLVVVELGYNDLCLGCFDWTQDLIFEVEKFESNFRSLLTTLRSQLTNTLVLVLPPFRLSQLATLTQKSGYCSVLRTVLSVECVCLARKANEKINSYAKMDELADRYYTSLQKLAKEFNADRNPSFAVSFDSGPNGLQLSKSRAEVVLSALDCFHPSKKTHEALGMGLWNNLFFGEGEKGVWDLGDAEVNGAGVVCPRDESRVVISY
ncbi:hypothetical protein HDV05_002625 [Chytridiales sp. JEL 0842]|nr:hypothetical protein HDV05_002625 [Chytridiales sp. JEL 0842]